MRTLFWNVVLALLWAALRGNLSPGNLFIGFLLGYVILFALQPILGRSHYFSKVGQVVAFTLFFLKELVQANLQVAAQVFRSHETMRAGVVAIPLEAKTDAEITLLANLITLTPGTLSIDVSSDRKTLYIHTIRLDDPDFFRWEIKDGLERWVLKVLR